MELRIFFPMMSMLSSGIFQTGVGSSISARLSRTKRCSCATFLDKECVYFCHLDIIWVNTPERTVSYGLGSVKKRSVEEVSRATEIPRCKCKDISDSACSLFCHTDKETGHEAAREKVISSADCAKKPRRIKRALKRANPSGERTTRNGGRGSLTTHKLLQTPPSVGRQGVLHFTKPF